MIVRVSAHRNRQSDKLGAPSTLDSVQQLTLLPRDALNLSFAIGNFASSHIVNWDRFSAISSA